MFLGLRVILNPIWSSYIQKCQKSTFLYHNMLYIIRNLITIQIKSTTNEGTFTRSSQPSSQREESNVGEPNLTLEELIKIRGMMAMATWKLATDRYPSTTIIYVFPMCVLLADEISWEGQKTFVWRKERIKKSWNNKAFLPNLLPKHENIVPVFLPAVWCNYAIWLPQRQTSVRLPVVFILALYLPA